MFSGLLSD